MSPPLIAEGTTDLRSTARGSSQNNRETQQATRATRSGRYSAGVYLLPKLVCVSAAWREALAVGCLSMIHNANGLQVVQITTLTVYKLLAQHHRSPFRTTNSTRAYHPAEKCCASLDCELVVQLVAHVECCGRRSWRCRSRRTSRIRPSKRRGPKRKGNTLQARV